MNERALGIWTLAVAVPLVVLGSYLAFFRSTTVQASAADQPLRTPVSSAAPLDPPAPASSQTYAPAQLDAPESIQTPAADLQRSADLLARWSQRSSRANALSAVTGALKAHRVAIDKLMPAGEHHPPLSAPLRALERDLRELGGDAPVMWRLDLRCSYSDLVAALSDIGTLDHFAVPVGLELAPAKSFDELSLQLWIWI